MKHIPYRQNPTVIDLLKSPPATGENKLRKSAEENPAAGWAIMNGNRIQIQRKQFEKFIDTFGSYIVKSSLECGIISLRF